MIDDGPLGAGSGRLDPMLLLAIPLAWALAVAVPFALLMLAFAILAGDIDSTAISPDAGAAFGLGLLWGVVDPLLGAAPKLALERPGGACASSPTTTRCPPTSCSRRSCC
jgi:hypothetical protein